LGGRKVPEKTGGEGGRTPRAGIRLGKKKFATARNRNKGYSNLTTLKLREEIDRRKKNRLEKRGYKGRRHR